VTLTIKHNEPVSRRWVVTMPNGRTFLVFTEAKVKIAIDCNYQVEELLYERKKKPKKPKKL
jgi:hypothetical protein